MNIIEITYEFQHFDGKCLAMNLIWFSSTCSDFMGMIALYSQVGPAQLPTTLGRAPRLVINCSKHFNLPEEHFTIYQSVVGSFLGIM